MEKLKVLKTMYGSYLQVILIKTRKIVTIAIYMVIAIIGAFKGLIEQNELRLV